MAKNLKLKIKNTQLAQALELGKVKKKKVAAKKAPTAAPKKKAVAPKEPLPPAKEADLKDADLKKDALKKDDSVLSAKKESPLPPKDLQEKESTPSKPVATEKVEEKAKEPTPKQQPLPQEPVKKEPAPLALERKEGLTERKKGILVDDFRRPKIVRKKALPPRKPAPVTRRPSSPTSTAGKQPPAKTPPTKGAGVFRDFRDVRSQRKPSAGRPTQGKAFDSRDRRGLRDRGDDERWRKRRHKKSQLGAREDLTIRPKELAIRLPVTVKDLASEMKLKASQLISKLFMQGVALTINDFLDDETTVALLGHEFGCEITIDTSEEERIKITDQTVREEIASTDEEKLSLRPPVITFMGHVDHGKTSLIDAIRKSDLAAAETGAITQHIGAFKYHSPVGEITILDTPGHEAFSAMRERGAEVTDLCVLVVAGDEGMRDQTVEAMNKAKEANVPILVAINKSDKPGFDADNVYRQLSEHQLLPETWGGTTITVNCSAQTKEGVDQLLEMLSLQSEVLELKADFSARARGSVIESAMHKGLGSVATLLVQNGTLKVGDALVFDLNYAKVKTMYDENGEELTQAGPSTPIKITGLSDLPEAGSEFIVVASEKEAREISQVRLEEHKRKLLQKGKRGLEGLLESKAAQQKKKVLHVLLRADVQGSLEALKHSLQKIKSEKVDLNIVSEEVGQISESDVKLAAASGASIVGFHTKVESHAETLIKEKKVDVRLHDIIYHAVDDIKEVMRSLLDKLAQENQVGSAKIQAVFKSSHLGRIAGCIITDGIIKRNHLAQVNRNGEILWKGPIASLKRGKEDIKEVSKGIECGILLQGFSDYEEGDEIEAIEITYLQQEL